MKPFDAPTIFIMAISSRRVNVASFIVLDIMKKDTMIRMTMRMRDTMLTMFLAIMKACA